MGKEVREGESGEGSKGGGEGRVGKEVRGEGRGEWGRK